MACAPAILRFHTRKPNIFMGRRSEHSRDELRTLIIDAALELIKEQGSGSVTARQIAKSIGYTPGMLYAVFKNQHDIFLHVNLCTLESLQQHCINSCRNQPDPAKRLLLLGKAYWSFASEHTHQFDLLFARHESQDAEIPPALPVRVQALFALVETALVELLSPSDKDPDKDQVALGARALWSGVHGATELGLSDLFFFSPENSKTHAPNAAQQSEQVIDTLIQQFVAGWLATNPIK